MAQRRPLLRRRNHTNVTTEGATAIIHSDISVRLRLTLWLLLTTALPTANSMSDESEIDATNIVIVGDATEHYTMAAIGFFFGLWISFMTVALAYFSHLEDALLQRFQREGQTVQGQVRGDITFVRNLNNNTAEYAAQAQYHAHCDGYTVTIRKQVKCPLTDFYRPPPQERSGSNLTVQIHVELSNEELAASQLSFDGSEAVFQEHPSVEQKYIQLLFLPEYPNSALPQRQVERDMSSSYTAWRPTVLLGVFLVLLTCFCIHMGLSNVLLAVGSRNNFTRSGVWGMGLLATTILFLVDALLVSWLCHDMFTGALQEEYLEGGEMIIKVDDETLATMSTYDCYSINSSRKPSTLQHHDSSRSIGLGNAAASPRTSLFRSHSSKPSLLQQFSSLSSPPSTAQ